MNIITRRTFLAAGTALTATSVVPSTWPSPAARKEHQLTIGYVPIACATPLIVADALELFSQSGLDVRLKKFAGWADLWTAYATQQIDVAHMLSPMPIAIDAGITDAQRGTTIAFTQNTNGQALTLASRHHGHVTTAQDLKGMVLGIPFEFSVHALLLRDYLHTHGLSPGEDVELRLLRPADMVAQLTVGTIDGFVGPEPFNERAVRSGAGRIYRLSKQLWDNHPCCCVAVAKDWAASHPEENAAVVSALRAAADFANQQRASGRLVDIIAGRKYLNQPNDLFEAILTGRYRDWDSDKEFIDPFRMQFGGDTSPAAITWIASQLADRNDVPRPFPNTDEAITAVASAVLSPDLFQQQTSLVINGKVFDPVHPTHGR